MTDMLDLIRAGQSNVDRLDDPEELKSAAEAVLEIAEKFGSTWLIPASDHAERILGAMLMIHGSRVGKAEKADSAVVFDVNVASGTLLTRAARVAKSAGAQHVYAIALNALVHDFESDDFEDIAVLDRSMPGVSFSKQEIDLSSSGLSIQSG